MADSSMLFLTVVALIVVPFISTSVLPLFTAKHRYTRAQPWIGLKKVWFARFRAGMDAVMNTREMLVEGYEKVRALWNAACRISP